MRILTAIGDAKERKRIASVLGAASHDVAEAATTAAAVGMLAEGFDIAFVDFGAVGALRQVPKRIYVIATVGANATGSEFNTAFSAGADDVMRITASKDEICGRAGALARIQKWAAPAKSITERLAAMGVWSTLDTIVGTELGELIGDTFTQAPFSQHAVTFASEIPLTLATEQLQIRLGLGIDAATMTALQQALLGGDTNPDALADAMREMANTAAGAIKRAALGAGFEFTIGLPTNANILTDCDKVEHRQWTLQTANGVTLDCVAIVRSNTPKLVVTRELREGMVLARDVRNPMGMLIAPAGTNLTRTTVEQLGRLLGATATLEVTDLAA